MLRKSRELNPRVRSAFGNVWVYYWCFIHCSKCRVFFTQPYWSNSIDSEILLPGPCTYRCIFSQYLSRECVANNEFKFFSLEKISGAQLRFSLIPHLNSSHSPIRAPEIASPPRHVFYKVTFLLIATTTNFSRKVSTQTNIDWVLFHSHFKV